MGGPLVVVDGYSRDIMSRDTVQRFLADAERAARAGDRGRALDLILLALDTAPGDADVVLRANLVRQTCLSTGPAPAERVAPPTVSVPIALAGDSGRESPARDRVQGPPLALVPDGTEESGLLAPWMRPDLPPLTDHAAGHAAPAPTASSRHAAAQRYNRQRWPRRILLGALGVALMIMAVLAVRPTLVTNWMMAPLARALQCVEHHDGACATRMARRALTAGADSGIAYGVLVQAATPPAGAVPWALLDSARLYLVQSTDAHAGELLMAIGAQYLVRGDSAHAVESYRTAFASPVSIAAYRRMAELFIATNETMILPNVLAVLGRNDRQAATHDSARLDSLWRATPRPDFTP